MSKLLILSTLLGLLAVVSCGKAPERGKGLYNTARCWSQDEARTYCQAHYIADGFTLEQAKLRCDPFYIHPGCYNDAIPASP